MFVEVIAVPPSGSPARLGERLQLREGLALRIGPSRDARIRLHGLGNDLELEHTGERLAAARTVLRARPPTIRASLNGRELPAGVDVPLVHGDVLYVHPGLVLAVRERPPAEARDAGLEHRIHAMADEGAWGVYRDFLEEHGDELSEWMRRFPETNEVERRRQLGALAESVRGSMLEVRWLPEGFLFSATLARQAVVGTPGLTWHLRQLAHLPVARFLRSLSVAVFAGAAPSRVDELDDPDQLAELVLDEVRAGEYAPGLQHVSLGFVSLQREWPRATAAWARLQAVAPRLVEPFSDVIRMGGRAMLHLAARPPGVDVVSSDIVLNPGRTDVGSSPSCLVRLVGNVAAIACTLHRMTDGQWVVRDETADPFSRHAERHTLRVNGVPTTRATLQPGDLVEPVPGLQFRFSMA